MFDWQIFNIDRIIHMAISVVQVNHVFNFNISNYILWCMAKLSLQIDWYVHKFRTCFWQKTNLTRVKSVTIFTLAHCNIFTISSWTTSLWFKFSGTLNTVKIVSRNVYSNLCTEVKLPNSRNIQRFPLPSNTYCHFYILSVGCRIHRMKLLADVI